MKIKTLPSLFLLASALSARAQNLTLAWSPSPSDGVTNYVLYAHTNTLTSTNLSTAAVKINVSTNLTAAVSDLVQGLWYFGVTAQTTNAQSVPSNIVLAQVPAPPSNMRTIVLQYSGTVSNFIDTGYFKLKLLPQTP